MRVYLRWFVLIPLSFALSGCMEPPPPPRIPTISFKHLQLIPMDVSEINIVESFRTPGIPPHAEHLMHISPTDAMIAWVNDRLRAEGGERTLQVIIKDASVVAEPLQTTPGVKGAFTNDQAVRYHARLEVEMRIYGTGAMSEASLNVVATRADTLAENANPLDRDKLFEKMIHSLMSLMNAELEKNLQQYFSNYIIYTPSY